MSFVCIIWYILLYFLAAFLCFNKIHPSKKNGNSEFCEEYGCILNYFLFNRLKWFFCKKFKFLCKNDIVENLIYRLFNVIFCLSLLYRF